MLKGRLRRNVEGFLDPGETIHESARAASGRQNHALVATDRHLYAFRLSWPGLANPVEVLQRIPLDDALVEVDSRRIWVVDRQTGEEIQSWARGRRFQLTYVTMPGHQELADYVNAGRMPQR